MIMEIILINWTLIFISREIEFTSYAREGAVLILPEGVTREDLVETNKIYAYLKEHASDWYQSLNAYSNTPLSEPKVNSSIFVVTGTDKAKIWSRAHFPPNPLELVRPTVFRYLDDKHLGRFWDQNYGAHIEYSDETGTSAEGKFPCALFLRGISVALSKSAWTRGIAPIPISDLPAYHIPSVPAYGRRADLEGFVQRLRRGCFDNEINPKEVSGDKQNCSRHRLTSVFRLFSIHR